jgi:hypothetical protein
MEDLTDSSNRANDARKPMSYFSGAYPIKTVNQIMSNEGDGQNLIDERVVEFLQRKYRS